MTPIRCPKCNRLIGYIEGRGEFMCPRCKDKTVFRFDTALLEKENKEQSVSNAINP